MTPFDNYYKQTPHDGVPLTGKMTGVVTTTSITNASPAAAYANSPNRKWEVDSAMPPSASRCKDIARQLIEDAAFINVSSMRIGHTF